MNNTSNITLNVNTPVGIRKKTAYRAPHHTAVSMFARELLRATSCGIYLAVARDYMRAADYDLYQLSRAEDTNAAAPFADIFEAFAWNEANTVVFDSNDKRAMAQLISEFEDPMAGSLLYAKASEDVLACAVAEACIAQDSDRVRNRLSFAA